MVTHAKAQPGAPAHHRQMRALVHRVGSMEEITKDAVAQQERAAAASVAKSLESQDPFDLAANMASLHRAAKARTHR